MKRFHHLFQRFGFFLLAFLLNTCGDSESGKLGYILEFANPVIKDRFTEDSPFTAGNIDLPLEYYAYESRATDCIVYSPADLEIDVKMAKTSTANPADMPVISIYLRGYTIHYEPLESADRNDPTVKISLRDVVVAYSRPQFVITTEDSSARLSLEVVPLSTKLEFLVKLGNRVSPSSLNFNFPRYTITMTLNLVDTEGREFTRTLSGTVVFGNQQSNLCSSSS
jgi:hypothetical protein